MGHFKDPKWGNRSQVQEFKVVFAPLDCIGNAHLREKGQLRQA